MRWGSLNPNIWSVCRVRAGDETLAVAGRDNGQVMVWNPETGRSRKVGKVKGPVLTVCPVRMGGRTLVASAGTDHTIWLWDPVARREVTRCTGHPTGWITRMCGYRPTDPRFVAAAGGDDLIVTAGHDGLILFLNPATSEIGHAMGEPAGQVQDMCLLRAGGADLLATASLDGAVRIWDVATGTLHALTGHEGWVHAVCPVPVGGGTLLASAGDDGAIRLWEPERGVEVRSMKPRPSIHTAGIELAGGGTVYALQALTSAGQPWLAAGGDFPGVWLWDPATGTAGGWVGWSGALDTKPECGWVRTLAPYPGATGPRLLVAGYDDAVKLFMADGRRGFSSF